MMRTIFLTAMSLDPRNFLAALRFALNLVRGSVMELTEIVDGVLFGSPVTTFRSAQPPDRLMSRASATICPYPLRQLKGRRLTLSASFSVPKPARCPNPTLAAVQLRRPGPWLNWECRVLCLAPYCRFPLALILSHFLGTAPTLADSSRLSPVPSRFGGRSCAVHTCHSFIHPVLCPIECKWAFATSQSSFPRGYTGPSTVRDPCS
jgi:hypothetical protein